LADSDGLVPIDMDAYKRSYVSGDPEGQGLKVQYFLRPSDNHLIARVRFGPKAEGPPGHAHGGSIAAVLDEAMGAAAWFNGHGVVSARLTAEFRRMLPLGTNAVVDAWVEKVSGRRITARGSVCGPDGKVYANGEGLFIRLPKKQVKCILTEFGTYRLTRAYGDAENKG